MLRLKACFTTPLAHRSPLQMIRDSRYEVSRGRRGYNNRHRYNRWGLPRRWPARCFRSVSYTTACRVEHRAEYFVGGARSSRRDEYVNGSRHRSAAAPATSVGNTHQLPPPRLCHSTATRGPLACNLRAVGSVFIPLSASELTFCFRSQSAVVPADAGPARRFGQVRLVFVH